jgi:hypothetical protein
MEGIKMKVKITDPFGFSKAINFEKLDDPETVKKKKAVNTLKKKVRK